MGDIKIISYKMEEYSETFKDLKSLASTLTPMASDLTYIKAELNKLKNKKIDMPDIDLSGIDDCKNKLDALAYACKHAHPPNNVGESRNGYYKKKPEAKSWIVA